MLRSVIVLGAVCAVAGVMAFAWCPGSATADQPSVDGVHDTTDGLTAAEKPCKRTEFKTELVKKACADGGQKAARKAMMAFMKEAKKKSEEKITCKTCHTKVSGDFPLTADAVEKFKKLGGK